MSKLVVGTVCAVFVQFGSGVASAESGQWIADSQFAQVNVACSRVYYCKPGQDILHSADTKVVTTPNKLVWGVCSAGDGPVDSCNVCLTTSPGEPCQWHVAPK
jgi:hypothetical protein